MIIYELQYYLTLEFEIFVFVYQNQELGHNLKLNCFPNFMRNHLWIVDFDYHKYYWFLYPLIKLFMIGCSIVNLM